MKKLFTLGALALSVAAVSHEQASAWINWKAGAGVNLGYQSGGNNFLWGAFRNGQPPGPEFPDHGGGFPGFDHSLYGGTFPNFGGYGAYQPMPQPGPSAAPAQTLPNPRSTTPAETQTWFPGPSLFQPVSFPTYYVHPEWYGE
jgi:hypothetical protein